MCYLRYSANHHSQRNYMTIKLPETQQDAIAILKPLANQMRVHKSDLQIRVGTHFPEDGMGDKIDAVSQALRILGADHVEILVGHPHGAPTDKPAGATANAAIGVCVTCHIKEPRPQRQPNAHFATTGLDMKILAENGVNFAGSSQFRSGGRS